MKKIVVCIFILVLCTTLFAACSNRYEYKVGENTKIVLDGDKITYADGIKKTDKDNIKVKFELETGESFVMELYPKYAPKTVANFCNLVFDGFYNGISFHRVIPGFIVQAGAPHGNAMGGSGKTVEGEFKDNGYKKNILKHERGTVSMARTDDPDSASSQFFVCLDDASHLDGAYAAFGKVVYGMEAVDEIAEATTDKNDKPLIDIVIKKASIITDDEFNKYSKEEK